MIENYNDPAFQKVDHSKILKVEASNGRNCRDCNKSNVCKYQETVVKEIEKLIGHLKKLELPLSININCKEWTSKVPNPRGV